MTANDAVFRVIRREYRTRKTSLAHDLDRVKELGAQLAGLNAVIANHRSAIAQIEAFADKQGWHTRDLDS